MLVFLKVDYEGLIPHHFKVLLVETYDGTTDLYDHLKGYKSLMMLQGASDPLMYKSFLATL